MTMRAPVGGNQPSRPALNGRPSLLIPENPPLLLRELRRRSFKHFAEYQFEGLYGEGSFMSNWHIDTIAWHLQQVRAGEIKRLIINLPPRMLKSHISTVSFPAWLMGLDPATRIIAISYAQDLSRNFSSEFRRLIAQERYQELFPGVARSINRNTEIEQQTEDGGYRFATSISGTLTGRGADYILIDDPMKADAAMSEAERRRVNEWFINTVMSRLNSQREGAIVIVMQRLHVDDLTGHLTEEEGHPWTAVDIPAIATEDREYVTGPRGGRHIYRVGDVIQPERMNLRETEALRTTLGTYTFQAQYQQNPVPPEGNLIRREWLHYYEFDNMPTEQDCIVQSWDTASNAGERNDWSVCTTWKICGDRYYLLDLFRRRMEYPALKAEARRLRNHYSANIVLIERQGLGEALVKDLINDGRPGTRHRWINPAGDKVARLEGVSAMVESGQMLIPSDVAWRAELERELLSFPGSRHDDQVDSISQFLNWVRSRPRRRPRGPNGGIIVNRRRSNREPMY